MKPGATTSPQQSIVCFAAAPVSRPTAAILSPATATSAKTPAAPVPSITVPPVNSRSYKGASFRSLLQNREQRGELIGPEELVVGVERLAGGVHDGVIQEVLVLGDQHPVR